MATTIKVEDEVKSKLAKLGTVEDTYNTVISRLLEQSERCTKDTSDTPAIPATSPAPTMLRPWLTEKNIALLESALNISPTASEGAVAIVVEEIKIAKKANELLREARLKIKSLEAIAEQERGKAEKQE